MSSHYRLYHFLFTRTRFLPFYEITTTRHYPSMVAPKREHISLIVFEIKSYIESYYLKNRPKKYDSNRSRLKQIRKLQMPPIIEKSIRKAHSRWNCGLCLLVVPRGVTRLLPAAKPAVLRAARPCSDRKGPPDPSALSGSTPPATSSDKKKKPGRWPGFFLVGSA